MGCGGTSRRRLMIATEWVVPRIRGGRGAAGFEEGDGFAGGGMAVGWFVRILFLGQGIWLRAVLAECAMGVVGRPSSWLSCWLSSNRASCDAATSQRAKPEARGSGRPIESRISR